MTKKKKPRTFVSPCDVCGLDWPWPGAFAQVPVAQRVCICQRCLLADLMRVLRECPERFGGLATVRALEGRPPVVVMARSGDIEKSA